MLDNRSGLWKATAIGRRRAGGLTAPGERERPRPTARPRPRTRRDFSPTHGAPRINAQTRIPESILVDCVAFHEKGPPDPGGNGGPVTCAFRVAAASEGGWNDP